MRFLLGATLAVSLAATCAAIPLCIFLIFFPLKVSQGGPGLKTATVNQPYMQVITVTNGTATSWGGDVITDANGNVTGLKPIVVTAPGLTVTISGNTVTISGTPTMAGTFLIIITAVNRASDGSICYSTENYE